MHKTIAIAASIIMLFETGAAFAQDRSNRAPREFTRSAAFENRLGTGTRVVEQRRVEGSVSRTITQTLDDGRVATREAFITRDVEAGTARKEITGTRFDGEAYSGVVNRSRTADGFVSEGVFTNTQGQTATRTVNAVVDQEAGTVTKNITRVNFAGEESSREVVSELNPPREPLPPVVE